MEANELKRKRIDDGKVEENLLNNNKFSALVNNNNNDDDSSPSGVGDAPADPAPGNSAGKQKQPPLVIKNTTAFYTVVRLVSECECTIEPIYWLTRFGTKLTSFTVEDFDKSQAHLKQQKVKFYSHTRRNERLHRVVLRGLPQLELKQVKRLLMRDLQLDALEVHPIKRKKESTVDETPYIVLFAKGYTNLKQLADKKVAAQTIIRWEASRSENLNVTQCKNCLLLGHGTRNCHLKARCNKCGGTYKTEECKPKENRAFSQLLWRARSDERTELIWSKQQPSKAKPPKVEKGKPVPEFNLAEFPPLPETIPSKPSPQPGGSGEGVGAAIVN